jgi:predicted neuraminidase
MIAEFIFDKAAFTSCHASTIVEPEPRKLIAAWFGGTAEGAKDVRIWSARHDGMTWSPPEPAAEEPGQPCWNPVLFRSRSGTVFLFYKAGPNPMSWTGFVRRSADGGKTWSAAEQLPAGILGPIKNKPIQLTDGTILAGTSVESYKAWGCWVERSKDDGATWSRFGPIGVPGKLYGIIQPTMFTTKDGGVAMLCRSRGIGRICRSESRDAGQTWTPAAPFEDLPNPNSGIDAVRTAEGGLFLVYNHTERGRSPLNLGHSLDDGRTWRMVQTLEDQPGEYSYPAIIQTRDGRLHITYTWQRARIKHVVLDPMSFK